MPENCTHLGASASQKVEIHACVIPVISSPSNPFPFGVHTISPARGRRPHQVVGGVGAQQDGRARQYDELGQSVGRLEASWWQPAVSRKMDGELLSRGFYSHARKITFASPMAKVG